MAAFDPIAYGERAAIMHYCGGLPKVEADQKARQIMDGTYDEHEQLALTGDVAFDEFRKWRHDKGW